jgi:hypothetical protein
MKRNFSVSYEDGYPLISRNIQTIHILQTNWVFLSATWRKYYCKFSNSVPFMNKRISFSKRPQKNSDTYLLKLPFIYISIEKSNLVTISTNVIDLAQDRVQWRSLVSTEFHERWRISWPRKRVTAALWSKNALRVCSDNSVRHRTDTWMYSLLLDSSFL